MAEEMKVTATNYDGLWGRQIKAEAERKQRMKEPTPRPWKWLPKEGRFIVDKDHNIVAEVPCTSGNPADGAFIVTAVNERDQLLAEVTRLREALVQAAIPYEALLMDAESRKWIAPEIWTAIVTAVTATRAALSGKKEGE